MTRKIGGTESKARRTGYGNNARSTRQQRQHVEVFSPCTPRCAVGCMKRHLEQRHVAHLFLVVIMLFVVDTPSSLTDIVDTLGKEKQSWITEKRRAG